MQQVLVYLGVALVLIGCLIGMYGGFKWKKEQMKTPALPKYREELKHKYARFRWTWIIMSAVGIIAIFIASYIR